MLNFCYSGVMVLLFSVIFFYLLFVIFVCYSGCLAVFKLFLLLCYWLYNCFGAVIKVAGYIAQLLYLLY